jgi:UDP-N-acetylmuramoyl-tripeptide--D-alanyl-D-alanine ligase
VVESTLGRPLESTDVSASLTALGGFVDGRMSPRVLMDGTVVIDDSYNANAASMAASITAAQELAIAESRPLVLVLGEMRELGELSASEHERIAEQVASSTARVVIAVGKEATCIADRARASGKIAGFAEDSARAIPIAMGHVRPGDVILVKGSRGVGTERIAQALSHRSMPLSAAQIAARMAKKGGG